MAGPEKAVAGVDENASAATSEKVTVQGGHGLQQTVSVQTTQSKYKSSRLLRFMTPKRCRWDPTSSPGLPMPLALLYAIVSGTTQASDHTAYTLLDKHIHRCQLVLLSTYSEQNR